MASWLSKKSIIMWFGWKLIE